MSLLEQTISALQPLDAEAMQQATNRINSLTMPKWALGALCDIGVRLAGITGKVPPPVGRRVIVTMAGDHGVVEEKVSLHGPEVTEQMVANIIRGGAGVNVLGQLNHARVVVADLGMAKRNEDFVASGCLIDASVGKGTNNMRRGPAMSREQAIACIEQGIAIAKRLAPETDVFGTGEMGIGNTTPATAIAAVLTNTPVAELTDMGTGLDQQGIANKIAVITDAIACNRPNPADGVDVLAKVGGFEIGGIAGLILGAAGAGRPVLVDGFISSAGAMVAKQLCPAVMDYVFLAHASAEKGHAAICQWLGQKPLLDLSMRLGEGTGAAMAMHILDASVRIMTDMATFDSAGVDAKHSE